MAQKIRYNMILIPALLLLIAIFISACGKVGDGYGDQDIIAPGQPETEVVVQEVIDTPEEVPTSVDEGPSQIVGEWVVDEEKNKTGLDVIDRPGEVIFIREEQQIEGAMCLPVSIFSKRCVDLGDGRINISVSNGLGSIQGIYFKVFSEGAKTGFEHFSVEVPPKALIGFVIDIDKWKKELGEEIVKVEAFPEINFEGENKVCINKKLSFNPGYSCKLV